MLIVLASLALAKQLSLLQDNVQLFFDLFDSEYASSPVYISV